MYKQLRQALERKFIVHAKLARALHPPLTPVKFYQRLVGYHGLRFSEDHQRQIASLIYEPYEALFSDHEEAK